MTMMTTPAIRSSTCWWACSVWPSPLAAGLEGGEHHGEAGDEQQGRRAPAAAGRRGAGPELGVLTPDIIDR